MVLNLLVDLKREFGLRREDFHAVIDGMDMDVVGDIRAPDGATLDLYCDRVASAVGRLSVRVFGLAEADGILLAHHLGRALQMTNILRDLDLTTLRLFVAVCEEDLEYLAMQDASRASLRLLASADADEPALRVVIAAEGVDTPQAAFTFRGEAKPVDLPDTPPRIGIDAAVCSAVGTLNLTALPFFKPNHPVSDFGGGTAAIRSSL